MSRKGMRGSPAKRAVRCHRLVIPTRCRQGLQVGTTADGRKLKFLNVSDVLSRLCLTIRVGRSFGTKDVMAVVKELTSHYETTKFIRSDNGPEFIDQAARDWCGATDSTSTAYIEPGYPWEKAWRNRSTVGSGMNSSIRNCSPQLLRLNS